MNDPTPQTETALDFLNYAHIFTGREGVHGQLNLVVDFHKPVIPAAAEAALKRLLADATRVPIESITFDVVDDEGWNGGPCFELILTETEIAEHFRGPTFQLGIEIAGYLDRFGYAVSLQNNRFRV